MSFLEGLPGLGLPPASGAFGAPPAGFTMAATAWACSVSASSSSPLSVATMERSSPVALATESTSADRAALALSEAFSLSSALRRSSTVGSVLGAAPLSLSSSLRFAFERLSHLRDSFSASS